MRGNTLLNEVMEGRMFGRSGQGRSLIGMLDELFGKKTNGAMKRRAEERLA